eukprot:1984097-Rhodomonas_salina.2
MNRLPVACNFKNTSGCTTTSYAAASHRDTHEEGVADPFKFFLGNNKAALYILVTVTARVLVLWPRKAQNDAA